MSRTKRSFAVTKISASGTRDTRAGQVEVEEPLEVRAGGREVAQLFRTPGHDIELAHGVLLTQGLITTPKDVITARYCEGAIGGENTYNLLDIELSYPAAPQFIDPIPSQSCGISAEQRVRELAVRLNVRSEFAPIDQDAIFAFQNVSTRRVVATYPPRSLARPRVKTSTLSTRYRRSLGVCFSTTPCPPTTSPSQWIRA